MTTAPHRILVVCLGNICRSPAAEAVLRDRLDRAGLAAEIDSAGTGDWHVGEPPYGPMQQAARARGNAAVGGLGMLIHQGPPAWKLWFGLKPEVTDELRSMMEESILGDR